MTKIKVFPHEELCPEGAEIEAKPGQTLAEVLLDNKIKFDYTGFDSLSDSKNEKLKYCHYYKDDHNMIYYIL